MTKDQVIYIKGAWYVIVRGERFGPWICKEYAQAGLQVEQRRSAKKFIRNVPWQPHCK